MPLEIQKGFISWLSCPAVHQKHKKVGYGVCNEKSFLIFRIIPKNYDDAKNFFFANLNFELSKHTAHVNNSTGTIMEYIVFNRTYQKSLKRNNKCQFECHAIQLYLYLVVYFFMSYSFALFNLKLLPSIL